MKVVNHVLVALILAWATYAFPMNGLAQIKSATPDGFLIQTTREIQLDSQEAYAAFVDDFSKWYDASHSYSSKAENISLDLEKHCMLETLPEGGFVRHMEIVFHQPGKVMRLTGGLGPLQGMGVSGSMTFSFSKQDDHSKIEMVYAVSGSQSMNLDKIAGPVNQVLNSQLDRFRDYCWKLNESSDELASDIEQVLAKDAALSEIRNHASEKVSLVEAIERYTSDLDKIDFAGCPPAFTAAFKKHRQAWVAILPLAKEHNKLRGEMHQLFEKIEQSEDAAEFKPLKQAIWDTWSEIEAAMK